jgi:predicted kinase
MATEQPRWPRGTPVGPSGRGPGGGRFRSGRDALAVPHAPLEGVTTGIFDRGFADLDEATQAFIDYRGGGFALISAAAAGTLTHPDWAAEPETNIRARQRAAAIDRVMQQSRLPHGIEVYRGSRAEYLFGPVADWPDDMTGREWAGLGYMSTSANSGVGEQVGALRPTLFEGGRSAMDFVDRATQLGQTGGLVHMTIRVPAGTPAVRLSEWEHEAEVLLDKGLRFRVTADNGWETVELRDGPEPVRMLEVEVIPADWAGQASTRLSGRTARHDVAQMSDAELDQRALEAVRVARAAPSTRDIYRSGGPMTDWDPERTALHEKILQRAMAQARGVPRQRRAIMAGGLPGAGKTSALGNLDGYLQVNPDAMKDELIAEGAIPAIPGAEHLSPMELNPSFHVESTYLADRLLEMAMAKGYNVVIDATMGAPDAPLARLALLREAGYATRGVFVDVPVEVSMARVQSRYREGMRQWARGQGHGGRPIPADLIESQRGDNSAGWTRNRAVFEHLAALGVFSGWDLYDNSGDEPRLVRTTGV